jgi:hypothetical protein
MNKYQVLICRVSYAFHTTEIEANSQEEAEAIVLDMCGDYNFSEKEADYTIESIKQVSN